MSVPLSSNCSDSPRSTGIATRTGLAPELILAVIQVESAFKPTAVSHAGARGLMQVMPFWKREITAKGENWVAAKDEDEAALKRW